jgi:hypothetical protein
MGSPTVSMPSRANGILEHNEQVFVDRLAESSDIPETRTMAARGALTGVLLGAGLWGGILVLAGVIKL